MSPNGIAPWRAPAGRHDTVRELASEWNLSPDYVRRVFAREPGVLVFSSQRPGRRVYRVLRIPLAVAERVYRRSQVPLPGSVLPRGKAPRNRVRTVRERWPRQDPDWVFISARNGHNVLA